MLYGYHQNVLTYHVAHIREYPRPIEACSLRFTLTESSCATAHSVSASFMTFIYLLGNLHVVVDGDGSQLCAVNVIRIYSSYISTKYDTTVFVRSSERCKVRCCTKQR